METPLGPVRGSTTTCGSDGAKMMLADDQIAAKLKAAPEPSWFDPCYPSHTVFPRLNKWSCGMNARALIDEASFGAEAVKAMGEAFDQAWARIAPTFGNLPQEVETARLMFAEMICPSLPRATRTLRTCKIAPS